MKTAFTSTLTTRTALMTTMARQQRELPRLQQEVVTGRNHDSGLVLGAASGKLADLRHDLSHVDTFMATNSRAGMRLDLAQASMQQVHGLASGLVNNASLALSDPARKPLLAQMARDTVAGITAALNVQSNGSHVFGGVNTDAPPLATYDNGPAQTAFRDGFQSHFGFPIDSGSVATVGAAQMEDFLTNVAAPMFLGPDWSSGLSAASDATMTVRIGTAATATVSLSANERAFRQAMLAGVVASELYDSALTGEALDTLSNFVIGTASDGINDLTRLRGATGLTQQRLQQANEALDGRKTVLERQVIELDGVDTYQRSVELNTLLSQVELSYSITSRIQQLSLLNYI
jgi:flagellar hook-associated protein 3 FlgL